MIITDMKLIKESENKAVITTRFVVENNSTITYVSYDDDGDWQFFGNEDITENDALVISIKQILDIDQSLKDIPEIQEGQNVTRNDINSPWQII
jgi:hypothetical protein